MFKGGYLMDGYTLISEKIINDNCFKLWINEKDNNAYITYNANPKEFLKGGQLKILNINDAKELFNKDYTHSIKLINNYYNLRKTKERDYKDKTDYKHQDGTFKVLDKNQLKDLMVESYLKRFKLKIAYPIYKNRRLYIIASVSEEIIYNTLFDVYFSCNDIDLNNTVDNLYIGCMQEDKPNIIGNLERFYTEDRIAFLFDVGKTLRDLTYNDALKPIVKNTKNFKFEIEHKRRSHKHFIYSVIVTNKNTNETLKATLNSIDDKRLLDAWPILIKSPNVEILKGDF